MASERAKISPDLVQHIMQYAWELRVAETPAGADGDTTSSAKKKFPVKDEAVVATAEVLRLFAEEITARAAETAIMDGDDTVDGGHLERILPQLMLDFAT
jgi:centromere protein X|tara:strand:- start:1311 stop:1610 length:300 start_codon:yes stop_codon:yes gene_type:complete